MTSKLYVVDAFSDRHFHGNPAGVCVLDRYPADELMLNIAAENNLSETAFVVPSGNDFAIRWFRCIPNYAVHFLWNLRR